MRVSKYLAAIMAVVLMCGAFTACNGGEESKTDSVAETQATTEAVADATTEAADDATTEAAAEATTEATADATTEATTAEATTEAVTDATTEAASEATTEATAEEVTQAPEPEIEDKVVPESGQAYLAIADSQWWLQYMGKEENMLAYNAGVADITGNGSYTVSVTADTNGFRYQTTGDVNGVVTPSGVVFTAVIIKDGETVCPNAIITIDKIRIDGKEIPMVKKSITNTEEGCIRANIYNSYVKTLPGDARTADGPLFEGGDLTKPLVDNTDDYSAQIIDPASYNSWTTVEVDFTITGM